MTDPLPWPPELRRLPGLYDPFSAASHLVAAAAFLALGVLLLRRGRGDPARPADPARLAALAVYAGSCMPLFAASGLFHAAAGGTAPRALARRLDHAAIFMLIAASFTPALGILFAAGHGRCRSPGSGPPPSPGPP